MTPSRPYLLRALHQWISDNGMTPYIMVDAEHGEADVPPQYVEDGKIVLNLSHRAVTTLELGNEWVSFEARFKGESRDVHVPIGAVLAIYARENGKGMVFNEEEGLDPPPEQPDPSGPQDEGGGKKPALRLVK